MKVAIVHHQYAKKGGMESYCLDLVNGFLQQNWQVTVFTYQIDKRFLNDSVPTVVQYHLGWCPKRYRKFFFIHRINKKFNPLDFDLSLNLTRSASQDIAVCGGTHRGFLASMQKTPCFKDRLEIYYEQKSFDDSPHVMAHSSMLVDEITQLYRINAQKVNLLHPPINTDKFHFGLKQDADLFAKKFNIDRSKINLLFPSTGHKRKGLFELLIALKELPATEFQLLVAGNPIKNVSVENNVRYLGYVNNMADLYAAVDFMILPSYYEPFGLVAIESVQCGTPVILSNKVGAKDLITTEEGVVFEGAVNAENIVRAVKTAQRRKFNIAADFAKEKGLTIEAHINKIITFGRGDRI